MKEVYMTGWIVKTDTVVELKYNDKTVVNVNKSDFDRDCLAIISAEKDDVIRNFAIATA